MPIQGFDAIDDKKLGREKPLKEGGPDPEKEDRVMLIRTRVSRIYFLKKFFFSLAGPAIILFCSNGTIVFKTFSDLHLIDDLHFQIIIIY